MDIHLLSEAIGRLKAIIPLLLVFIAFSIYKWTLDTARLVSGEPPKEKGHVLGTFDLIAVTLFLPGLIYVPIIHFLMMIAPSSVLESYIPALFTFSILVSLIVFMKKELNAGENVSTGMEWIPLSALLYPAPFFLLFILYPVLLAIGKIEKIRDALRRIALYVSVIWLSLGFYIRVFSLGSILFLGPVLVWYILVIIRTS